VPLEYDGPYSYAYMLSVGFLADGSTPADWRAHFYQHQGQICPVVDVPAVGDDAFLVRCDNGDGPDYTLVLRDARTGGLWFLDATARTGAAHSSSDALGALVEGVREVYG
jgi:hypothetical protein